MLHKTYFNWSSGKDSAMALHLLQQDRNYSVEKLLTSVNAHHNRVSMHGLRRELLQQQVAQLGLPATTIEMPEQPDMAVYEQQMINAVSRLKEEGFTHAAFGDIFLEDLRRYREEQLAKFDFKALFPIWKRDTRGLMRYFIENGFQAVTVCVNATLLDESFVGRLLDENFLNDLPPNVDPCGENGEFHTFCFNGPVFKNAIPFTIGEKIYREYDTPNAEGQKTGFWFCDLLPA